MRLPTIVLFLALSGCATPVAQHTEITEKARAVLSGVKTFCQFAPSVASVVQLVSTTAAPTAQLVAEVCLAVTTVPLAEGGTKRIVVRGIIIKGKHI